METNNIFDGAYSRIIEDEAWQRVSGEDLTGMKSAATETSAGRRQCLKNSRGGWIGTNCFILFLKYIFLNIQNNEKPCNFVPGKWESNR